MNASECNKDVSSSSMGSSAAKRGERTRQNGKNKRYVIKLDDFILENT